MNGGRLSGKPPGAPPRDGTCTARMLCYDNYIDTPGQKEPECGRITWQAAAAFAAGRVETAAKGIIVWRYDRIPGAACYGNSGKRERLRLRGAAEKGISQMKEKEQAYEWAKGLCYYGGKDQAFLCDFWERLVRSEGVYREFTYYLAHQNFCCEYKVAGYSVVDIMVWQMDHFKAQMDRGMDDMKNNGDKMLLMAFDTLLKMEKKPEYYVNLMQSETGTDYPGKYV